MRKAASATQEISAEQGFLPIALEALARELAEAREAGELGFYARVLAQVTLPHSRPTRNEYVRRNGDLTLSIWAPPEVGLPYASVPRLLLAWLTTEAVRTRERRLVLGNTLSAFMRQLDLVPTGGRWGTIPRLRSQMERLFAASVVCTYRTAEVSAHAKLDVAAESELWWDPRRPGDPVLWNSTVLLGERFFEEVIRRPVPIDLMVLRTLRRSPLALDLYVWMTHRFSYLREPTTVPWEALQLQFGSDYSRIDNFRAKVRRALSDVVQAYPAARVHVHSSISVARSVAPLHPDLGRLAALVGEWRGEGEGTWEGRRFAYRERVGFWHSGRPFLGYTQRTVALEDGRPLHSEAGYWRAAPGGGVELVLAHAIGHAEVEVGRWEGERLELSTRSLIASPTAKKVARLERSISLAGDRLVYELRMAAPDGPARLHLRARLDRVPDTAGGDVSPEHPPLRSAELGEEPIAALRRWHEAAGAAGSPGADGMALATASGDGTPSVRMVLLRGLDEAGLVFHSNRESRKGRELEVRPRASVLLHWELPVHRQVRVEGRVEPLPDEDSDAYFRSRPTGARISAWASPQSAVVASREELEDRWAAVRQRFAADGGIPRPPFWGGYRLVPEVVEFWQGRQDRFHDRIRFRREAGGWIRERLAP